MLSPFCAINTKDVVRVIRIAMVHQAPRRVVTANKVMNRVRRVVAQDKHLNQEHNSGSDRDKDQSFPSSFAHGVLKRTPPQVSAANRLRYGGAAVVLHANKDPADEGHRVHGACGL